MRKLFTPFLLLISCTVSAQDGRIDSTFFGGKVSYTVPGNIVFPERLKIAVDADGKIYQSFTAGASFSDPTDFGLARYNADGTLDNTFGTGGIVLTDMGGNDAATTLVLQADGTILVGGYSQTATNTLFALAKYTSGGILDNTFDGDGKVTTPIGTDDALVYAMVTDPATGKILLGGTANTGSSMTPDYDFALIRYNSNGGLDNTFGSGGKLTLNLSFQYNQVNALALQSDGKIIAAGFNQNGGGTSFMVVARFLDNGGLDPTFDFDGVAITSFGGQDDAATSVAVTSTGQIYAAGYSRTSGQYDYAIARYGTNGTLDNTFGTGGKFTTGIGAATDDRAMDIYVQTANGRIILGGQSNTGFLTDNNFSAVRILPSGVLDNTFGADLNGKAIVDFGADDPGYAVAQQGNKLILAGITGGSLALARLVNANTGVLPVTLVDFTATRQSTKVVVNWRTSSEENTSHFEVERSADGQRFTKLADVQAAGNSATGNSYSSTDLQPNSSLNYYRLKIVDRDGQFKYSKVVLIRFSAALTFQAFPNPVRSLLNLQVQTAAGPVKVLVMDATGRLVHAQELRSSGGTLSTSIDLSALKPGMYVVRVNEESISVIKE